MKYFVIILAMALLAPACSKKAEKTPPAETPAARPSDPHKHHTAEPIRLNNGEKWKVNEEMMPAIVSMEASINSVESSTNRNYSALAARLQKNIDRLTASCTMKGESHEELHKWLSPLIESVKQLARASNPEEQQQAFEEVKTNFNRFYECFE